MACTGPAPLPRLALLRQVRDLRGMRTLRVEHEQLVAKAARRLMKDAGAGRSGAGSLHGGHNRRQTHSQVLERNLGTSWEKKRPKAGWHTSLS